MSIVSSFPSGGEDASALVNAHNASSDAHGGKINNTQIVTTASISSANLITVSAIKGVSAYSELPNQFLLLIPSISASSLSEGLTMKILGSSAFQINHYNGVQVIGQDLTADKPMLLLVDKTTSSAVFASGASGSHIDSDKCIIEVNVVNQSAQTVDLTSLQVVLTDGTNTYTEVPGADGKLLFSNIPAVQYTLTINNLVKKTQLQEVSMPGASVLAGNKVSVTANIIDKLSTTVGFTIDISNSDPSGAIEYTDDAVGMTPGSIAWMDKWPFSAIFPAVHAHNAAKNSITKCSRNNPLKLEDGTTNAPTTDGNNHYTILPLMWIKISALSSTKAKFQITDTDPEDSSWMRFPYDTRYNAAGYGRYEGSYSSNRLGSRPGQTVKVSATRANFRTYAKANTGAGHTLLDFDTVSVVEMLFLLYYKSFSSQTVLGRGYVDGNSAALATGTVDSKNVGTVASHAYGETTGKEGMKFLWIENFWGNTWDFVDGINIISYAVWVCHNIDNYADDVTTNYTNAGNCASADGNPKRGLYNNQGKFIPTEVGGSDSTYYCDYFWRNTGNRIAFFGGLWDDASAAGAFYWYLNSGSSSSSAAVSGRCECYLELED